MANTLTGLYQTIYAAMNVVSRELIGFIPAVSKDSQAEQVTLNQPIRSPVVPSMEAEDIAPSNVSSTGTDQTIDYVDLSITKQRKVSFHLTGEEEKGLMASGVRPNITQQRIEQALRTLSNEIEADLAGLYKYASRAHGVPGTTPFDTADDFEEATQVMRILDDNGAPKTGRSLILNTAATAKLLGKQPSVFRVNESGQEMSRRFGQLETLFGFAFGVSGSLPEHDSSGVVALAVNNAGGEGVGETTLTVDGGSGAETLAVGDLVKIASDPNVYVVAEAMAGAATSLVIAKPGLRLAAANDAAIVHDTASATLADYSPNVAFTRDAFHLTCRVPAVPEGGDAAEDRMYVMDPYSGLVYEFAIYRQYRQVTYEVGICWGVTAFKPEHAAILLG